VRDVEAVVVEPTDEQSLASEPADLTVTKPDIGAV
jgi:hypothetical protein